MPPKTRDQLFKKSDVYRLVDVARAKNLSVARIDITWDSLSLVAAPTIVNGHGDENEWDEVLRNAANKERPC
jgi:hypothetical protein